MIERIRSIVKTLSSFDLWVVGLTVAASILSARMLWLPVIVSGFFLLIHWFVYGEVCRRTPIDWAVIMLTGMLPVTLWISPVPDTTLPQVYRLLSGIGLFYTIVNWANTPIRLRRLVVGFIAAGLALALSSLVSVNWPFEKFSALLTPIYRHFTLISINPVNPNVMAGILVIMAPIPLAWALFGWKQAGWAIRMALGVVTLALILIIGLTLSRGAWIAFGIGLAALAMLRWKWGWVAAVIAILTGVVLFIWPGITPVLNAILVNESLGSIDGRLQVWLRAIYMIRDFSFTGIGMGNFGRIADAMYPFFFIQPGRIPHAHNLFLQIAVDLGIPGLIAWLGIFLTIIFISWKQYSLSWLDGIGFTAALGAGLLSSQIALGVHGLMDAVTWGMVRSAPIVWALWGLAAAGWQLSNCDRNVGQPRNN